MKLDTSSEETVLKAALEDIRTARDQFKTTREAVMEMSDKLASLDVAKVARDLDNVQMRIAKSEEIVSTLTPRLQALGAEISQQDRK